MFARAVAVSSFILSLSILAAAMPGGSPPPPKTTTVTAPSTGPTEPASSCSTGSLQCCNSVAKATDPAATGILGLLGIVVQGVDVLVGLTCDPISVIGAGGGSCSANAVCCQNNSFGSLISIGCVPVIL